MIYIVAGGPVDYLPNLKQLAKTPQKAIWIGVDHGCMHITNAGIQMQHAIGDFDSVTKAELAVIQSNCVEMHTYNIEKNESDLELAIHLAMEKYDDEIILLGATGGRLDHQQANIFLLTRYPNKSIRIVDNQNELFVLLAGSYTLQKSSLPYISFIPISDTLQKVSLKGFKYNVKEQTFYRERSLGISNEICNEVGHISFSKGICLVVRSGDSSIH